MVIMGGNFATGKRDRRVTIKTSEQIRDANPNRVNYDVILQNRNRSNLMGRIGTILKSWAKLSIHTGDDIMVILDLQDGGDSW